MKQVICLEKNDIKTSPIGLNFCINVNDEFAISLTPDAIEELWKDYQSIKQKTEEVKDAT